LVRKGKTEVSGGIRMKTGPIHPIEKSKVFSDLKKNGKDQSHLSLPGRMGAGSFVIGTLIDWLGVKINPSFLFLLQL